MTREQIREAIREMDCLDRKEADALAELIYEANERRTEYTGTDAYKKAAAVIDWMFAADKITFSNKMDLRDLIL